MDDEATARLLALGERDVGRHAARAAQDVWWWTLGMTWTLVNLRGLDQMMYRHGTTTRTTCTELMAILRDGHLAKLDFLEQNGLLSLNNDGTYVGSGGFGWTRELPQPDFAAAGRGPMRHVGLRREPGDRRACRPRCSQEFIFPYQLPILERFGLNCYGCCEPLRQALARRPADSPPAPRVGVGVGERAAMAEMLGDRYIFSWKPTPADLAMDTFDEEAIRAKLREAFRITRGCRLEVIMKDNNTIRNDPEPCDPLGAHGA